MQTMGAALIFAFPLFPCLTGLHRDRVLASPTNLSCARNPTARVSFSSAQSRDRKGAGGCSAVQSVIGARRDPLPYGRGSVRRRPRARPEFLERMEKEAGIGTTNCRVFMTGSGGATLAGLIGAKFVQEVTAVSLAVEKLHPEVNSVIELGGQDAKIIVFKEDENTGRKKKIPSMND